MLKPVREVSCSKHRILSWSDSFLIQFDGEIQTKIMGAKSNLKDAQTAKTSVGLEIKSRRANVSSVFYPAFIEKRRQWRKTKLA